MFLLRHSHPVDRGTRFFCAHHEAQTRAIYSEEGQKRESQHGRRRRSVGARAVGASQAVSVAWLRAVPVWGPPDESGTPWSHPRSAWLCASTLPCLQPSCGDEEHTLPFESVGSGERSGIPTETECALIRMSFCVPAAPWTVRTELPLTLRGWSPLGRRKSSVQSLPVPRAASSLTSMKTPHLWLGGGSVEESP